MLGPGERIPTDARVWPSGGEPTTLGEAVSGPGHVLLCFYPYDWSST